MQMSFDEILPTVNDCVKEILQTERKESLYMALK